MVAILYCKYVHVYCSFAPLNWTFQEQRPCFTSSSVCGISDPAYFQKSHKATHTCMCFIKSHQIKLYLNLIVTMVVLYTICYYVIICFTLLPNRNTPRRNCIFMQRVHATCFSRRVCVFATHACVFVGDSPGPIWLQISSSGSLTVTND